MLSDEQIEVFRQAHGRVKYVTFNGVDLVFRKPKRAECQQYMMKREDGGAAKIAADEQLAQQLIIVCGDAIGIEARKAFLLLLEDFPLLVNEKTVGGAIGKLAGIVQDDDLKNVGSTLQPNGSPQTTTP